MLKTTRFIYGFLLIILLGCLLLDVLNTNKNISYLSIAYFIVFLSLSAFLLIRGFYYKIDTNIYFGVLLFISPISQILIKFNRVSYPYFLVCIFSVLSIASLLIWWYFKDKSHKKLFFAFLGEIIIFFLPFYLTKISIWVLIIMSVAWFVLTIALSIFLNKLIKKR